MFPRPMTEAVPGTRGMCRILIICKLVFMGAKVGHVGVFGVNSEVQQLLLILLCLVSRFLVCMKA